MNLVKNNHVAVKPTPEAMAILAPYLSQGPFTMTREDVLHVTTVYSRVPLRGFEPSTQEFKATIQSCQVWYDPYMGIKDLVIVLQSPELEVRQRELSEKYGSESVYESYLPHLTLAYDIPDTNPKYRWFINEMMEVFSTRLKGTVLKFNQEYLESSSGIISVKDAAGQQLNYDVGPRVAVKNVKPV